MAALRGKANFVLSFALFGGWVSRLCSVGFGCFGLRDRQMSFYEHVDYFNCVGAFFVEELRCLVAVAIVKDEAFIGFC